MGVKKGQNVPFSRKSEYFEPKNGIKRRLQWGYILNKYNWLWQMDYDHFRGQNVGQKG